MEQASLVIASNNKGKIKEIKEMTSGIEMLSLADIGFTDEIDEPYETFEENAYVKANTVYEFAGKNVFSDDSGICIPALNDKPGVHSAYFGGLPRSDAKNNQRLLRELDGVDNRTAYYKAVICLIWDEHVHYFEGYCYGKIAMQEQGSGGFGYDPLFMPDGYDKTFGELDPEVKNKLSHRGEAVRKMVAFLNEELSK